MDLMEVPVLLASLADPDQLVLKANPVLLVSLAGLGLLDPLDQSVAPDLKVNQVHQASPVDQDLQGHKEVQDPKVR